jgi:hypothetical protein
MMQQEPTPRTANSSPTRCLVLAGSVLALACLSAGALAQSDLNGAAGGRNAAARTGERGTIGPSNTTVGGARLIVPDGTSLTQNVAAGGEDRWFVFGAEAGKTYTVEVANTDGDLNFNEVSVLEVKAADGTSDPPEANFDCTVQGTAPAMQSHASSDGMRCVVRTFVPDPITTLDKRAIYVHVVSNYTPAFRIRVRESTIYGRWTTNGYDFHVELQNTTTDSICAQIILYPGTGTPGPTAGSLFGTTLTIPPKGAGKIVRAAGSTSGGDNKGTMRIHACPGSVNFVSGSLIANTYAYNPVTNLFVPMSNSSGVNGGSTSNSW